MRHWKESLHRLLDSIGFGVGLFSVIAGAIAINNVTSAAGEDITVYGMVAIIMGGYMIRSSFLTWD